MASSIPNPNQQIFCAVRREYVAAGPEELVRQKLISYLIHTLQFPASHIVVEKSLKQMPHVALTDQQIPDRRADIVCYAKGIHPQHDLYPLLLIECKAIKLSAKVVNQVAGYNHFLKSYFIAIANPDEIQMGWWDSTAQKYQFIDYIPVYAELMAKIGLLS